MNTEAELKAMFTAAFGKEEPSCVVFMCPRRMVNAMAEKMQHAGIPVIALAAPDREEYVNDLKGRGLNPADYLTIELYFLEKDFDVVREELQIDKAMKTDTAKAKIEAKDKADEGGGTFH